MDQDHVQEERLSNALMDAFPTSESLKRMVYYKLGVQFGVVEGKNLPDTILNLIEHMRSKGRLKDLVRGACEANSSNKSLLSIAKDIYPIVSSQPAMRSLPDLPVLAHCSRVKSIMPDISFYDRLVDALGRVPIASSYEGRSHLLYRVPGGMMLNRVQNNARQDLEGIVRQLALLGLSTEREIPLLLLIDAALPYVDPYEPGVILRELRAMLIAHYEVE